jgi:hypothetical protein
MSSELAQVLAKRPSPQASITTDMDSYISVFRIRSILHHNDA